MFFNDVDLAYNRLERLREEVCQRFGRKVAKHRDVVELADQLKKKTETDLSTQTVKRFFGLIKDDTKPSAITLDTLSIYLGYSSWEGFIDRSSLNLKHEIQRNPIQNGLDFYLKDIPTYWEAVFYNSRDKAAEIYKMPDNEYKVHFFEELGKVKNAHDTFWEWFPNLNVLRKPYYRNGLISYRNAINTPNTHCFTNGMLFLGSYLCKNDEEIAKYYKLLQEADTNNVWPLPMARCMATLVIGNSYFSNNADEIKKVAVKEYIKQQENELNRYTNSYASIFIEYLVVAGLPHLVKEFLDLGYYPFNYSEFFASAVHYHEIRTVEALILAITEQKVESKKLFMEIKLEKYHFNNNLYYGCFYAILAVIHGNDGYRVHLSKLIAQTGYTRFYDLLDLYCGKK